MEVKYKLVLLMTNGDLILETTPCISKLDDKVFYKDSYGGLVSKSINDISVMSVDNHVYYKEKEKKVIDKY